MIIDDYAHHPSEVSATLQAAKSGWNNRLIAIFQPHLFSRCDLRQLTSCCALTVPPPYECCLQVVYNHNPDHPQ